MKKLGHPAAFAVPIAYAAGLWLAVVYLAAGENSTSDPGLLVRWLRDATFALPLVFVAVWAGLRLADAMVVRRREPIAGGLARAVTIAAVAVAGGAALGGAMTIAERVFGSGSTSLPLPVHVLRDTLLALFATVPVAALVVAVRHRLPQQLPSPEPGARRSSRAAFLKAGAGGLVSVAGGAAALRAVSSTSANAAVAPTDTVKVYLTINEGYCKMTDGSSAWMRGFALNAAGNGPLVPGPAIGNPTASVLPGEVPFVLEGQTIEVHVKNTLGQAHTFSIPGVVDPPLDIPAFSEATTTFIASAAGTYIYQDDDEIQRILGLHGVMVVMPADQTRRPYGDDRTDLAAAPTFSQQYVWVLHDVDPVWGEYARKGMPIDPVALPLLPRYFTINGVSGQQSVESGPHLPNRRNVPIGSTDTDGQAAHGALIRIANTGGAIHSPHLHGNHFYVLTMDNQLPLVAGSPALDANNNPVIVEKDVLGLEKAATADVLIPFHEPLDQWPPYDRATSYDYRYPMHCHAEMSQTAGGGQYPSGMYVEFQLSGALGEPKAIGG
jgi:hypothetical protein